MSYNFFRLEAYDKNFNVIGKLYSPEPEQDKHCSFVSFGCPITLAHSS